MTAWNWLGVIIIGFTAFGVARTRIRKDLDRHRFDGAENPSKESGR